MTDLYPHRLADTSPWANPRSYAPDCGELLREHIRHQAEVDRDCRYLGWGLLAGYVAVLLIAVTL